jgi:glycerol-3-phosphate acyltransferase PlsY
MFVPLLIFAVVGYLLGSLPFGFLVARTKGVNIFEVGSKNPGATNVRRVLGHGPGNLVLALDALKGTVATAYPLLYGRGEELLSGRPPSGLDVAELLAVAGLMGALIGHAFSCFTHFKGGKGVATGAGGFVVLFPLGALAAAVVWGLAAATTRYVSLASMLAGVGLTLAAWWLHASPLVLGVCAAAATFVIVRHRGNLARLLTGTEPKIGSAPPKP